MVIREKEIDLSLPPVLAKRTKKTFRRNSSHQHYSFLEAIKYYTGTDGNLIWGPFYGRFRAARRDRESWPTFGLGGIWEGIPAASQTRPDKITRFLSWVIGLDPPPALTYHPPASRDSNDLAAQDAGDWSPARIDFVEWHGRFKHPADYSDEFYRTTYRALYERLCDFGEKWFGAGVHLDEWRDAGQTEPSTKPSTWEVPLTEQFVQYAREVAHEDRGYVSWSDVLSDPDHRKWLCGGIFAQIIERRIFNELLFGAGNQYKQELERHDSLWLMEEGFTRKEGRRQLARASLGETLLSANFWNAVDDLAGQTVLIFQPLLTLISMAKGRTGNKEVSVFWQEVHTLLAIAGYFQICMAVSPSIFHIVSATPGARFEWEEEEHADRDIYNNSRDFHRSHEDRWRIIAELSAADGGADVAQIVNSLPDDDRNDVAKLYAPLPENDAELRTSDHHRRRGGKVMYAVFPKITRYSAENIGILPTYDPAPWSTYDRPSNSLRRGRNGRRTNRGGEENEEEKEEGMRINLISKSLVVYYQGLIQSRHSYDDGIPLEAHINQLAWDAMPASFLPYFRRSWDTEGHPVRRLCWPLWPSDVDVFWLYWLLHLALSLVLSWAGFTRAPPPPSSSTGRNASYYFHYVYALVVALFYRPVAASLFDVGLHLVLRWSNSPLGKGYYRFWKLQALGLVTLFSLQALSILKDQSIGVFSLLTPSLYWMDDIVLQTIPNFVLAIPAAVLGPQFAALSWLFKAD